VILIIHLYLFKFWRVAFHGVANFVKSVYCYSTPWNYLHVNLYGETVVVLITFASGDYIIQLFIDPCHYVDASCAIASIVAN